MELELGWATGRGRDHHYKQTLIHPACYPTQFHPRYLYYTLYAKHIFAIGRLS